MVLVMDFSLDETLKLVKAIVRNVEHACGSSGASTVHRSTTAGLLIDEIARVNDVMIHPSPA